MHRRTVIAAGTAALAGCSEMLDDPSTTDAEALIREGINEERAAVGAGALDDVARLREAARAHSRDMAERDFYAHENPDGQGPGDRAPCRGVGENLHRGEIGTMQNVNSSEEWYTTDAEGIAGYVVEGWVLSAGHYDMMTRAQWGRVGVGVVLTDDNEFFATAVFC